LYIPFVYRQQIVKTITILRAGSVPQLFIASLYTVKKITIKNTTMEEKNIMKKSNRTLALITAAVSALSAAAAAVPVQSFADDSASANSYKIDKNIIRSTYFNRNSDSYDFGGRNSFKKDGKKDYYDYLIMEDEIVDMYAKAEYPNRKLSCSEVKLSEGAENAGLTPSDLDINHDGFLSPRGLRHLPQRPYQGLRAQSYRRRSCIQHREIQRQQR